MAIDLETGLLRAFVTSARAGSISRAATALGHSQPALSQQLRKLERAVGQPLLHRATTGVSLTRAGEALLPYAERILVLSAEALNVPGRALAGHCAVGLIEDLTAAPLPQALADFTRLNPGVTLELFSAPAQAMREAFDSGRVDLLLGDPFHLLEPPRWTVRVPLAWAAGPGFDADLDPIALILFSQPCRWRTFILRSLEAAGRGWRVAFESTSLAGIHAAVQAGLGATALLPATIPPGAGTPDLPALPDIELGLVRRPGREGDPLLDAVEGVLRRLV